MLTITRLFDSRLDAEQAIRALREAGIPADEISLMMPHQGSHSAEDDHVSAAGGAAGGTVVGGLTGLLMGLGALAVPGVGPLVAAGPLASALAGALTGAATGGLLGALLDLGIDEEKAHSYQEALERGAILVAVRSDEARAAQVRELLDEYSHPLERHRERWEEDPAYRYRPASETPPPPVVQTVAQPPEEDETVPPEVIAIGTAGATSGGGATQGTPTGAVIGSTMEGVAEPEAAIPEEDEAHEEDKEEGDDETMR